MQGINKKLLRFFVRKKYAEKHNNNHKKKTEINIIIRLAKSRYLVLLPVLGQCQG